MKLLNWLFGKKENEGRAEIVNRTIDEIKAYRDAEILRAKLEWVERNEKQKKIDACYLGTRRMAFHGTYEEYMALYSGGSIGNMRGALQLIVVDKTYGQFYNSLAIPKSWIPQ